jgi:SAM-dependent methyltransferase
MTDEKANSRAPEDWIRRFAPLIRKMAPVLDVAAGNGRHSRYLSARGHPVTAVDRDTSDLAAIASAPALNVIEADLENGSPWPLGGRRFGAVVVTYYLWRPLFPVLLDSLDQDGLLLYQTFAQGQEAYGWPNNPHFLLRPGELLEMVRGSLTVLAYEHGQIQSRRGPSVVQRIVACRGLRPLCICQLDA